MSQRQFSIGILLILSLLQNEVYFSLSSTPHAFADAPLTIIDEYSHPKKGEFWSVRFQTQGTSDLVIYPNDQATIDDMDFVSLTCDNQPKEVTQLTIGDIIYAKNYECQGISTISHRITREANHMLKFQFAGQTAYAHNEGGVDWTVLPPGIATGIKFSDTTARSVAYGADKFVVVGVSGYASYSSDGITWTVLPSGAATGIKFSTTTAYAIAYGSGKFVVVGASGKASYSSDGITWTALTPGADTGIKFSTTTANAIAYGGDKFVVVGDSGYASYSSDGITWTVLPSGADTGIKFSTTHAFYVAYGADKFLVVGNSGKASYSSDGITWTVLPSGVATGIKFSTITAYSIAYGSGKFLVVGNSGYASYSSDGITWTALTPGADTGIKFSTTAAYSIAYGGGKFVVVGASGYASYSSDGITWTVLPAGADTGIKFSTTAPISIAYGGGKFLVVGTSGKASYSIADSTPPAPSSFSPVSGSTISDTTQTITFTTDENATCYLSLDGDEAYADMSDDTLCSGGGTTSQSCTTPDLGSDGAKTVYIACTDGTNADTTVTNEELSYTLDTSPPVPSSIDPASGSTISDTTQTITFTTDENATCYLSLDGDEAYADMSDDTLCSGGGTTSQSCTTPDLGSDGAKTVYIACTDGTNADTTVTNEELSYTLDTTAATISAVSASATDDSATITWTTNESGSSLIQYGTTSTLGSATSETNTSPRVTAHEVALSSLPACTTYHYRPISTDASSNTATGSIVSFTTTGCTNSAAVASQTGSSVTTSGGNLNMTNGGSGATVDVPASAATNTFTLQIKKIDKDTVIAATSTPSGVEVIGDHTYDFRAISGSTLVTSFLQPITVVMTYTDAQVSGYDESSLWIHRWDGSSWNALDSCVVDTTANTVTCTTTNFSTFGLFGNAESAGSTPAAAENTATATQTSGGRRGGTSAMAARITAAQSALLARYAGELLQEVAAVEKPQHAAAQEPPPTASGEERRMQRAMQKSMAVVAPPSVATIAQQRGRLYAVIEETPVLYRDVPTDAWFTPYVAMLIEENIAQGYKDETGKPTGEFGVANPITYAEVLKMALASAGYDVSGLPPPRNVSARGSWANAYTAKAEELGLTVFTPERDVHTPATRGEVVQTILEVLKIPIAKQAAQFSDVPRSHPYANSIATAAFFGFITGDTDSEGNELNTFRPDAQINRAEVAKIIALMKEAMK